jgi:cbb3-type cytochrome oxidase maturation protein
MIIQKSILCTKYDISVPLIKVTNIILAFAASHSIRNAQVVSLYKKEKQLQTMSVIILLVCFSLLVAGSFLGAFLWAIRDGQYEDDYSPSVRILFDSKNTTNKNNKK